MPGAEIDTTSMVRKAFLDKKAVFVPYIHKSQSHDDHQRATVMDMVSLHSVEDMELLKRDKWGIPTLASSSVAERRSCINEGEPCLDLIIMPGVAFDHDLNRIGHGKGFYDFFLQRYHKIKRKEIHRKEDSKTPFLGM
jgi:5-formyltetrahydrofolate cyclo-ligase